MEKSVEILFTNEILNQFITAFNLEPNVKKLGDFESYVFETYKDGHPFILRITHSSHRSAEDMHAELDWMNFLHQNDVHCPQAFLSSNNQFIETIDAQDGSSFHACLSSKVNGVPVKVNSEQFTDPLFFAWGKAIGKMHAVTKDYQVKEGRKTRPFWHEEELLEIEKILPDEKEITAITDELFNELNELPQNRNNFGLIHSDVHSGNFFYDGESIHVFDFDDCSYHWFASDIAIPLYYSIFYGYQNANTEEKEAFASRFLTHFLQGYETENELPENLLQHIPLFLRLRDITLYSVFHKKIAPEDRDERLNKVLAVLKQRIIQKEPLVKL